MADVNLNVLVKVQGESELNGLIDKIKNGTASIDEQSRAAKLAEKIYKSWGSDNETLKAGLGKTIVVIKDLRTKAMEPLMSANAKMMQSYFSLGQKLRSFQSAMTMGGLAATPMGTQLNHLSNLISARYTKAVDEGATASKLFTLTSISAAAGIAAIGVAAIAAVYHLKDFAKIGGDIAMYRSQLDALAKREGKSAIEVLGTLREAVGNQVDDFTLMKHAMEFKLSGTDFAKMPALFKLAEQRADMLGMSVDGVLDLILRAEMGMGQRVARVLKLNFSAEDAEARYAASIGKTSDKLTEKEKKLSLITAILQTANTQNDMLAGSEAKVQDSIDRLNSSITNLKNAASESTGVLAPVWDVMTTAVNKLTKALQESGGSFIGFLKLLAGSLSPMTLWAEQFSKNVITSVANSVRAMRGLAPLKEPKYVTKTPAQTGGMTGKKGLPTGAPGGEKAAEDRVKELAKIQAEAAKSQLILIEGKHARTMATLKIEETEEIRKANLITDVLVKQAKLAAITLDFNAKRTIANRDAAEAEYDSIRKSQDADYARTEKWKNQLDERLAYGQRKRDEATAKAKAASGSDDKAMTDEEKIDFQMQNAGDAAQAMMQGIEAGFSNLTSSMTDSWNNMWQRNIGNTQTVLAQMVSAIFSAFVALAARLAAIEVFKFVGLIALAKGGDVVPGGGSLSFAARGGNYSYGKNQNVIVGERGPELMQVGTNGVRVHSNEKLKQINSIAARGGNYSYGKNQNVIVGERGPELMQVGTDGVRIHSNDKLNQMGQAAGATGNISTALGAMIFDDGGRVNEPVVGRGMHSGRMHSFAGDGPDHISTVKQINSLGQSARYGGGGANNSPVVLETRIKGNDIVLVQAKAGRSRIGRTM